MEQTTQFNDQVNINKPKKKGKIVLGIILAIILIAIIALVAVYFLVFSKPDYIFSKTIDDLLTVNKETYNSTKVTTEISPTIELKDFSLDELPIDINKIKFLVGAQMDYQNPGEIVDLGLSYDDEDIISGRLYYEDGTVYVHLNDLLDQNIRYDVDEEQLDQMSELFDLTKIQNKLENADVAITIFKNELKEQMASNGSFEANKEDIDLNGETTSVDKFTYTVNEEELVGIIGTICDNLANNDEFLECFEESPKADLENLAQDMEDIDEDAFDNNNELRISLYTKGILHDIIGMEVELYSDENEELSINLTIVKETDNLISVNFTQGKKYINASIENNIEEQSEEKQSGNAKVSLEISDLGTIGLDIDYEASFNQGIDEFDTKNSVEIDDISEEDAMEMMEKLMERPLIKEGIEQYINMQANNVISNNNIINGNNNNINNNNNNNVNQLANNQLTDNGYTVSYQIPTGFEYDSDISGDSIKFYDSSDGAIQATTEIQWQTDDQSVIDTIDDDYSLFQNNTTYSNIQTSDVLTINSGNNTFNYKSLSYVTGNGTICQIINLWYRIDNDYVYRVRLESTGTNISDDDIMPFLNIQVQNQ